MMFSVIVCVYNVEKHIRKCIDSILTQTYKDFELILVDDGSPDKCPQICDGYAKSDSRVKVIHKKNGGLVSARNAGIMAASGNYICYVDGDDWIDGMLLETIYQEAIQEYEPDMVIYGIVKKFKDRDEEILNDLPEGLYTKEELRKLVYPYMMYDNRKPFCKGLIFPAACNKIYSRNLLLEHYCREEKIKMGEDNAFVFECAWFSNKVYICNKIFYCYNQLNPGAMNQTYDQMRFRNNRYLYCYIEKRLSGLDPVLDEQINAFKAYWLIMAVFHEIKSGRRIREAAIHIKREMKSNRSLDGIHMKGLPKTAIVFLFLLKLRMYHVAAAGAAIVQKRR